jgi:probable rRNA maturation factor
MPGEESPLVFLRAPRALKRRALRAFAATLRQEVAGGRAFGCLLTDDRELQRLNREFLGKDYPTDVLSFPEGQDGPAPGFDTCGEMAISVNRAAEQARERGHSLEQEIEILMLHGVLHLLGMDHETDRGRMARAERRWRKQLGLSEGLIERTIL